MWSDDAVNARVHEDLLKLIDSGEAYAFLGAGLSAGLYPLWDAAITEMVDRAAKTAKGSTQHAHWRKLAQDNPLEVLNMVWEAMGDELFLHEWCDLFSRGRLSGERFTIYHSTFMQQPFRGFVTTNYDDCLISARNQSADVCTPDGSCTWQNGTWVTRWRQGRAHDYAKRPILFLHGRAYHPESVVATGAQYQAAYAPTGKVRPLLEQLWVRERLVIAGFSFRDPYFQRIIPDSLREMAPAQAVRSANHIVLWGVEDPSDPKVASLRQKFREEYCADLLVYQVRQMSRGEVHDDLLNLLPQPQKSTSYGISANAPPSSRQAMQADEYQAAFDARDNDLTGRTTTGGSVVVIGSSSTREPTPRVRSALTARAIAKAQPHGGVHHTTVADMLTSESSGFWFISSLNDPEWLPYVAPILRDPISRGYGPLHGATEAMLWRLAATDRGGVLASGLIEAFWHSDHRSGVASALQVIEKAEAWREPQVVKMLDDAEARGTADLQSVAYALAEYGGTSQEAADYALNYLVGW